MPANGPSGGVRPQKNWPGKGKQKKQGDYYEVPYGSYDPSIAAQRRAAERGLGDLRDDTKTANKWSRTDLNQNLNDIARKWTQGKQDIRRSYRREGQKLDFRKTDLKRDAGRNRQDFSSKLADIGRKFGIQAGSQKEAQNASGTLYGGTAAAAAAKRAENQAYAEKPIAVAQGRMEQDLTTNLARIGTARTQLGQDTKTTFQRGKTDTKRSRKLTKLDSGRGKFDRGRKLQRGIREQKVGDADLMQQSIYSARQTRPGAFNKFGKKKGNK